MRIIKVDIEGFKGNSFSLDLTGRDLIVAGNMVGKTTIKEALDFFATGAISTPGFKREDLIDYCPDGRFEVKVTTDTGMTITRWFRVKKGGATEIDLVFDPDGLEENYTERRGRLTEEFEAAPLITFDLAKFVYGDDAYRLETCMSLLPLASTEGVKDKMHLELEAVGDKLRHATEVQSEKAALTEVQGQLQGFAAKLPTNLLGRCNALAGLVKDKWAKTTRAEVKQKEKAVRALGTISREDGVTGVNVEALQEQLRQAQSSMDELQKASGAAEERRRLILDFSKKIEDGQAKKAIIDAEIDDMSKALNEQGGEYEKANGLAMKHEEDEQGRIQNVYDHIEALESEQADWIHDYDTDRAAAKMAEARVIRVNAEIVGFRAIISAQEAALIALDAAEGHCTVCASPIDADSKELLLTALREKLNRDLKTAERLGGKRDDADQERADHEKAAEASLRQATDLSNRVAEARKELEPVPYSGLTPDAIQDIISKNEMSLDRSKINATSLQDNIFGWMKERGELANEMPKEMEEQAIAGAETERDRIATRIEEAKRARQRFEDQEKLRSELDTSERRLAALTKWATALGLKGLAGKILADQFSPMVQPAAALVRRVLPDAELAVSWETPRGNPGMRLFLNRNNGEKVVAYKAMSGAEKAIVGTAVALAFAGSEAPPNLLCLECEVMDDAVEKRYLEALADLAGPTSLLVMTHHGHDDLGVYAIRNL